MGGLCFYFVPREGERKQGEGMLVLLLGGGRAEQEVRTRLAAQGMEGDESGWWCSRL